MSGFAPSMSFTSSVCQTRRVLTLMWFFPTSHSNPNMCMTESHCWFWFFFYDTSCSFSWTGRQGSRHCAARVSVSWTPVVWELGRPRLHLLLYFDSPCLCTIHNCNSMFREPHSTFLWVLGFAYFMADSDHMQMDTEPRINPVVVALLPHSAHLFSSWWQQCYGA